MKKALSIASLMIVAASGAYASGPAGTVTFEGAGVVETPITDTCTADGFTLGDYYKVVYRYRSDPNGTTNDGLNIYSERSAFHILASGSSGSLNGSQTTTNAVMDSHGGLTTGLASSVSLTIGSAGGNPTATAVNLKVVGTINDFFNNAGCTITFHAVLVARPD